MSTTRMLAALAATGTMTTAALVADAAATPAYAAPRPDEDVVPLACTSIPSTADPAVLETVYRVGRGLKVTERVMLAGFEAGWVESHMNNLPCGDRDSLGVFQQRPSQGWGTPEQIMNVSYAANAFFTRAIPIAANNPGMTAGQIAQAVQRSAFPDRYDQAQGTALALIDQAKDLVTGKVTVGFYQASTGTWQLKNTHSGGAADISFQYGPANARPLSGDWNNDGKTTVGYYVPATGTFNLRNANGAGPSDHSFRFGPPGMVPLAGDWDADGKTTVGYYNPGTATFHLRNTLSEGPADHVVQFGPAGSGIVPVVGDWNNDGKTTVGYYNRSTGTWNIKDTHASGGPADHSFVWRGDGLTPITGDWNADGKTTVGFYRPSDAVYLLRDSLSGGPADHAFSFGPANRTPITGDWNND